MTYLRINLNTDKPIGEYKLGPVVLRHLKGDHKIRLRIGLKTVINVCEFASVIRLSYIRKLS